ncbi:MAG: hypothetical protein WCD56_20655 [Pseudolabrys sp.]|jgi:hypothetical protein
MPPLAVARRFCATLILMGLLGAAPAKADIEKFMRQCDGKLCASFRASITIPDGWIEDKEATSYFNAQVLLPKGLDFEKAPAKIYAVARYNRDKRPISDFLPDRVKDWKSRAKDARINKLDDLARGDKPPFLRHAFEAHSLKEQGCELQAVTSDGDKDGNQFVVTFMLSADSKAALKDAEPAFLAILSKY